MKADWNIGEAVFKVKGDINRKFHLVGALLVDVSKALAPTGKISGGRLKDSINYAVSEDRLRIGTNVEYAPFVEFKTQPHIIRPRDKRALYWEGAKHPVKEVHHPGTKAQPFLGPLLKDYDSQIMQILSS